MKVTRGRGILESFLAKKRAHVANKLILKKHRLGSILDIGCGTTPFFLINTRFKKKYGLDPSLKKTSKSKDIMLKKFSLTDKRLPFEDNSFDVITMLAVFEHIEKKNLKFLLSEIRRILKKDGRFILTTPCTWTDGLLRSMAKVNLVSKEEIEEHKGAYSHKSIEKYIVGAGFKKEKIRCGYFEFYLNNWAYVTK